MGVALLVATAMALQAMAGEEPALVCDTTPLVRMPLTTQVSQAAIASRVTTPSGYVVAIMRDTEGWEVTLHRVGAKKPTDSLLYPKGPWHGAFPCQVQPGADFPDLRYIAVRGTSHHVCVRLVEPRVEEDPSGSSRFAGGWLEVSWALSAPGRDSSKGTGARK